MFSEPHTRKDDTAHVDDSHERPDRDQVAVITAEPDRAILLEAGPGSGKTRTLIGRISYLLARSWARPDEIVAVTFTNKAAHELQEHVERRLEDQARRLIVGTFHALAHRILRRHASVVGVDPRFTVCDELLQEDMLRHALQSCGLSQYADAAFLSSLRSAFSACKRARHDPAECKGHHAFPTVAEVYQALLRRHNMLDFDDLILYASKVLYEEAEIATVWRRDHPWLFVDEFHDIDPAQYQFVQLLAPPGSPTVMAVVDEHQSIYRWRGSDRTLLARFCREYRPRSYTLARNYRSGRRVVEMCDWLLRRSAGRRQSAWPRRGQGFVERWWHADEQQESEALVAEINRLVQEEGHTLGEIALLYRTHRTGERLEQLLVQRQIPLQRIQRQPFFAQPDVLELRRYLQAAVYVADEFLAAALNFPRIVADELTMIQLRRVAARREMTLIKLMRVVGECEELGPATRRQVGEFLRLIEEELAPFTREPLRRINDRLFRVLDRRRSPFRQSDLEGLRAFVNFFNVDHLVLPLQRALAQKQPIQIVASESLDGHCAALILRHLLEVFFSRPLAIESLDAPLRPGALRLVCGASQEGALNVTERDAGSIRYPATISAWRLAAAVLIACETAPRSEIVAFDLETTGLNPRYDRPVELAAQRLRALKPSDDGFECLVHPGRSIPIEASNVHGIFPEDVRHAPHVDAVFPAYLDYLGDAILLGHNVEFDLRFLVSSAQRLGRAPLRNPVVDTMALARRLFPEAPGYSLEALVGFLKLPPGPFHRAMADVRHTVHLFQRLWQEHRLDQQLHVLVECLPLVGAVLVAQQNEAGENGLLVEAAGRVLRRHPRFPWLDSWLAALPGHLRAPLAAHITTLARRSLPATADDQKWAGLREQWERHCDQFLRLGSEESLQAFLAYTALIQREPDIDSVGDRLQLMTIHAAKGKEFRTVFLVGLEAGTIPFHRATSREEAEEERRVCYVGMSRARERLYLLGCAQRDGWARDFSPFWNELTPYFSEEGET